MRNSLLCELSSIQLPIEYLWLSMDYDNYLTKREDYTEKLVTITHPECLTGEDRAATEGASSNRYPRAYDRAVTDLLNCDWEEIYEFIHFDDKAMMGPFKPYFAWLEKKGAVDIIPFSKKYGSYNPVAKKNMKLMNSVTTSITDTNVIVSKHSFGTPSLHRVEDSTILIPTILKYLENGQNVIYIPEKATSVRWVVE
jgi:hypothetical protein